MIRLTINLTKAEIDLFRRRHSNYLFPNNQLYLCILFTLVTLVTFNNKT